MIRKHSIDIPESPREVNTVRMGIMANKASPMSSTKSLTKGNMSNVYVGVGKSCQNSTMAGCRIGKNMLELRSR